MKEFTHDEFGLIVRPGEIAPLVPSLILAEKFGKKHYNILATIKTLLSECSPEFTELNFKFSTYRDSTGRELPCYFLTQDGFTMLAMGFSGPEFTRAKEGFINRFNYYREQATSGRLLLEGPDAPALIRKVMAFVRRLTPERKLEIKRAVRYQALGLTRAEIGRLLGCGPTKAGNLLKENRWLNGGGLLPGGGQ